MMTRVRAWPLIVLLSGCGGGGGDSASPEPAASELLPSAKPTAAALPAMLIPNQGQWKEGIRFALLDRNVTTFFTPTGFTMATRREEQTLALRLSFVGASTSIPQGEGERTIRTNFFKGSSGKWRSDVPTYLRVVYPEVWPNINMVYESQESSFEYTAVVKPGGDPASVRLLYQGIDGLSINDAGEMVLETEFGQLVESKPIAFQNTPEGRKEVPCQFALDSDGTFGFEVGDYDPAQSLFIDPVVMYATYLTYEDASAVYAMTGDADGNIYLTGETNSGTHSTLAVDHPTLSYGIASGGDGSKDVDVFVTKRAFDGSWVWTTWLGGTESDTGYAIGVNPSGAVYVAGSTSSKYVESSLTQWDPVTETYIAVDHPEYFPITAGALDTVFNAEQSWSHNEGFVASLHPSGKELYWCTYIGGMGIDAVRSLGVDAEYNVLIAGTLGSTNELELEPYTILNANLTGVTTGFVGKISNIGDSAWISLLGDVSSIGSMALDNYGNFYVTGATTDSDFCTTLGYDTVKDGGTNPNFFLIKVSKDGATLASTLLGSNGSKAYGYGVALDGAGDVLVTGYMESGASTFLPSTTGAVTLGGSKLGSYDAFVAKFDPTLMTLKWVSYLGGGGREYSYAIAVDAAGDVYVTGQTESSGYPITSDALDTSYSGMGDIFVSKVSSDGKTLLLSSFVGGASVDLAKAIRVENSTGSIYLAGHTYSTDDVLGQTGGYSLSVRQGFFLRYGTGAATPPVDTTGWEQVSFTSTNLYGVRFVDASTGWAVGSGAKVYGTTDGGTNWTLQYSLSGTSLYDLFCINGWAAWAVGGGLIVRTTDGGATWTKSTPSPKNLYSVYFVDGAKGWSVGQDGTILRTTDGGATWITATSGVTKSLYGVYFVDASNGYAVGASGTLLCTGDGGVTWSAKSSGTTATLYDIRFADGYTGWMVGSSGKILRTTDGGTTWSAQSSGTTTTINSLYCVDKLNAWAVGWYGVILRTTDGGATWTPQSSGTTAILYCVASQGLNRGWIGGQSVVLRTTTGGS